MNFKKRFRVELDRAVWAPVGKDPLCTVPPSCWLVYCGWCSGTDRSRAGIAGLCPLLFVFSVRFRVGLYNVN